MSKWSLIFRKIIKMFFFSVFQAYVLINITQMHIFAYYLLKINTFDKHTH